MDAAEKVLPRYFSILKKESLPYFKLCRKIPCQKQKETEEMWVEHAKAIEKLDELKGRSKAEALGMEDANYSLLDLKIDIAYRMLESCTFCERRCKVNRREGQKGWCRVTDESHVSSMFEHMGEEHFLIPSGTIFFSGCTWECSYCLDGSTIIPIVSNEFLKFMTVSQFDELFPKKQDMIVDVSGKNLRAVGLPRERRIIQISRRFAPSKMLQITTKKGKRIILSGEHRMIINDSGKAVERRVDQLKVGEEVVAEASLPPPKSTLNLNLIEELVSKSPSPLIGNVYVRNVRKLLKRYVRRNKSSFVQISKDAGIEHDQHRYKRGVLPIVDFYKVMKSINAKADDLKEVQIGVSGSEHPIRAILPITKNLMRLIGYFVAEGNYRNSAGTRDLVITSRDKKTRDDIRKCLQFLNS
jgi:hypothetical protein